MVTLDHATFGAIARLMHATIGLTLPDSKLHLVATRLAPRLQTLGLDSYEGYHRLIAGADIDGEFQVAVDLLTTNETYFFREKAHFELLEREWKSAPRRPLQLWSAAASYGDEAYSLAMQLADMQMFGQVMDGWSILGTDISDRVLRTAVAGIYPEDRLRHVSPERLRRHCLRGEGEDSGLLQVKPELRRHVRFGRLNLCQPFEDIGLFDVILLRNVLIYFDPATKQAVTDRVLQRLRPGGLFLMGLSEGRITSSLPMQAVAPGAWRLPNTPERRG